MAIYLGGTIINKKLLGVNKLNKIMLGAIEVFPNLGNVAAFTPADLFKDGSKGFWYDLTDLSTLFQDAAGTIPVTAAGQPIGMVMDKSGNNNHLTQTNNAKRPLYGTSGPYARMIFDGLTSAFKTAPFAMGSDKFTLFAGYANDKDTGTGTLAEFSPNYLTNAGSFAALIPSLSTSRGSFGSNGGSGGGEKEINQPPSGDLTPRVFTCYNDFATDDVANGGDYGCDYIRANGQPVTGLVGAGNSVVGAGPYGTHSLFVGARNETSNYLGGYIYQLVGVGKTCTDDERSKTEQFIYQRIPTPIITVVGEFPAMTVGTPITPFTFTAVGGTSPYTFTEIGGMPDGLTLASNGYVEGTPTMEGAYSTTIEAIDALGFTGDRLYTGTVAPAAIDINISGDFPASMTVGEAIAPFSFSASGGTAPYTFSVQTGALPDGLTMTSAGLVSGTPTNAGGYDVTIDATDSLANNGYVELSGSVAPAVGSFTPADLFQSGEQGAWYDLSDISTLFQDSAGSIPVTDVEQPVGKVLDKSGNGNHLIQATAAKRPLYQSSGGLHWLKFDGVDDEMANTSAPNTQTVTTVIGRSDMTTTQASRVIFGNYQSNTGLIVRHTPNNTIDVLIGTGTSYVTLATPHPFVAGEAYIQTSGIANSKLFIALNSDPLTQSVSVTFSPAVSDGFLVGRSPHDANTKFDGKLNSLIYIGRELTTQELTQSVEYSADKTGVTLP